MMLTLIQQPAPAKAPPRVGVQAPVPPNGVARPPVADIGTLQAQLAELTVQQAGLRAQWDGLRRQLDNMLQTNPARPGVQQEWADVGVQLAQVDGQVAAVKARLSQLQGAPIGTPQTRSVGRRSPPPEMIVGGMIALSLAIVLPLSIAWAIRIIRRGRPRPAGPRADEYGGRFDRLEQAVDAIAIEVERISEGQRFVTKIMADRPAQLGAGAAEPVRVGERDAVRAANTSRRD
jgi:hypothetical protein